ncbi:MAG: hypothetical protein HYX48_02405 [Chlamydiales bacterium]|nr:hypothetical protein [Chlamydiales bacterium]
MTSIGFSNDRFKKSFDPEQLFAPGVFYVQSNRRNTIELLTKSLWHLVGKTALVDVRAGREALLKDDFAKIRKIAEHIRRFYQSPEMRFFPTLFYIKGFVSERPIPTIVQRLVRTVFGHGLARAIREKARYALILLEKTDPHLKRINQLIRTVKDKTALKKDRDGAFFSLVHYARGKRERLEINFPIRPFNALSSPPMVLSASCSNSNSKLHNRFWKIGGLCSDKSQQLCLRNLEDIGDQEGFKVSSIDYGHKIDWLRDPMLCLQDGTILLPARLCFNKNGTCKDTEAVRDILNNRSAYIMGAVAQGEQTEILLKGDFPSQQEAPFYFETGNLLYAMNGKDELLFLSGAQNLLFSFLNSAFTFSGREEALIKYMEGMGDLGRLSKYTTAFSKERVALVKSRLCRGKVMPPCDEKTQVWLAKLSIAAIEYIKEMMEETLGLPVIHIGDPFRPQLEFHLDIFIFPAPNGKIFIQDHLLCIQLLERLIRTAKLPESHRARLKEYLEAAKIKQGSQSGELERTAKLLAARGFEVVGAPGLFFDRHSAMRVNFLNSIVGKGKKGAFCISNGSSHPADELLRMHIVEFYKAHGIERVYFTGRGSRGAISATGGLEYIYADESLADGGGVHCRTQEINGLFKPSKEIETAALPIPTPKESFRETLPFFFETMVKIGMRMKTPELPEAPLFRVIDPPLESKEEFKESKESKRN